MCVISVSSPQGFSLIVRACGHLSQNMVLKGQVERAASFTASASPLVRQPSEHIRHIDSRVPFFPIEDHR